MTDGTATEKIEKLAKETSAVFEQMATIVNKYIDDVGELTCDEEMKPSLWIGAAMKLLEKARRNKDKVLRKYRQDVVALGFRLNTGNLFPGEVGEETSFLELHKLDIIAVIGKYIRAWEYHFWKQFLTSTQKLREDDDEYWQDEFFDEISGGSADERTTETKEQQRP